MTIAPPPPGTVIRYAYLWADEERRGKEEGRKDRPALVFTLLVQQEDGFAEVLVLAITHFPPHDPEDAVALPIDVQRRIGLAGEPAWIVTTEVNAFTWPGPDIRPVPNRPSTTPIYGRVPDSLLFRVARSVLSNRARQRIRIVQRSE